MFGDFGGGFIAPRGGQAGVQPFGGAFGGFMTNQVPMSVGAVAYYPAVSTKDKKKKKREETPNWPFQGPMRAEHAAPYGYMGPLPY